MVSASVKDVAALAGVSVGTVSNVLNRPQKVSAEVTLRVQSAIDKLRKICDETDQIKDYGARWVLKNWEFHRALYSRTALNKEIPEHCFVPVAEIYNSLRALKEEKGR